MCAHCRLLPAALARLLTLIAAAAQVSMMPDALIKNMLKKSEGDTAPSHTRSDVALMIALKEAMGKKKSARGSAGKWTDECAQVFARGGDKELKKFMDAREVVAKAFGNGAFLLNPLTMYCPLGSCGSEGRHTLNGLSGIKHFYTGTKSHLNKCVKHIDCSIVARMKARLTALQAEGGALLTTEVRLFLPACTHTKDCVRPELHVRPVAGPRRDGGLRTRARRRMADREPHPAPRDQPGAPAHSTHDHLP